MAQQTMATNEDFGHSANLGHRFHRRLGNFKFVEAGHATTVDTDEVRMFAAVGMRRVTQFEPPDMITQFFAYHQACFDQIRQVSQDGRLVESQWHEARRNVRMRRGRTGPLQPMHHGQASRSRPESATRQELSRLRDGIGV